MSKKNKKTCIIVGGTSGIGLAIANLFYKNNYEVLVASRRKKKLSDLKYIHLDLQNPVSINSFFKKFNKKKINSIILTSSVTIKKDKNYKFSQKKFKDIFNTNVAGYLNFFSEGEKIIKKSKTKIVIINSVASKILSEYSSVEYVITKKAQSVIARYFAKEWSKHRVIINSIYPSMTDTDMLHKALSKKQINEIKNKIPLKKILQPEEIANLALFLCSDKNNYIHGAGIDVNGGLHLTA